MSAIRNNNERAWWPVLLPVGYALLTTVYIALRYGYRWAESDTALITEAARNVLAEGTITPAAGSYQHGFGYPALVGAVSSVTGLSITATQLIVLPFMSLVIALAAFVAFRALTGNALLGAVAALLLLIQPEFLFVIQRGSHEKVTQLLVLLLIFLLVASLTRASQPVLVAGFIVTFYLLAWTLIVTNSFFGSSFLASLVLALIGALLALRFVRPLKIEERTVWRLTYASASCFVLLFIFVEWVYAPVQSSFDLFRSLLDRLAVLALSFQSEGSPYQTVGATWVAPWVQPLLSTFNWLVIGAAAAAWLWLALRFRRAGAAETSPAQVILWLFAAAFAAIVGISIIIDLSGFLGANLQIRLFPFFMLFAIPLVVLVAADLARRLPAGRPRRSLGAAVLVLFAGLAAAGILKATSDPLVSNKWIFFTDAEQQALAWTDRSLSSSDIWIGFDERLRTMQTTHHPVDPQQANRYGIGPDDAASRYLFWSDVIERRGQRMTLPGPNTLTTDRIYDNGSARLYHRVPESPYQP